MKRPIPRTRTRSIATARPAADPGAWIPLLVAAALVAFWFAASSALR